jgi:DNA polymerase I-like protein with 3'-5' exonuclease and polymerase domains
MSLVFLDFETFYGTHYSLSKMTTEQYIRDEQFQVIGFAYSIDDAEPVWVTGTDDIIEARIHELDLHKHTLVCHNTAFDGAILAWRYGVIPKLYMDTMSMAKPLHGHTASVGGSLAKLAAHYQLGEKGTEVLNASNLRREQFGFTALTQYGRYCANDVVLTRKLFYKLLPHIPKPELYIIDLLIRMYTDPVLELNEELLSSHLTAVRAKKEELLRRVQDADKDILMSNPKFAALLEKLGVEPPMKESPATGKQTYAFSKTDPAFKALQDHEDPRVQAVVAARLGVKSTLEETRTESLIGVAQRGTLPIMLQYYGAATGRCSGGEKMNLQNLPSRGGLNTIRRAITAPAGHKLVACDSSQIEARIVAWLAGETEMVRAFADKQDVYKLMATKLYSKTVDEIDKQERFIAKTVVLGAGYGMSANKFRDYIGLQGVKLTEDEADQIITTYRKTNANIAKLWRDTDKALSQMVDEKEVHLGTLKLYGSAEGFHLPNGMIIRYPGLRPDPDGRGFLYNSKYGPKKLYGAAAVENIVQALARIVVFTQMCKMDKLLKERDTPTSRYRTVLSVHDETVLVVPEHDAQWALDTLTGIMSAAPGWAKDLPVACEGSIADNYGDAK